MRAGRQPADSPLAAQQALVDVAIPQHLLAEQLIGQQHQQCGHSLKQDAVGDVPGYTTTQNKPQEVHKRLATGPSIHAGSCTSMLLPKSHKQRRRRRGASQGMMEAMTVSRGAYNLQCAAP